MPSLAEIRRNGQKPRYREEGNWLARHWARPAAVYGTWLAIRLGIPPHAITVAAGISWLLEAVFLAMGDARAMIAAVAFGYLGFWLDHVDGQVARVTGSQSLEGIFLDFWIHTAHACMRGLGIGWGLYVATNQALAILPGLGAAFGWVMISNANDASYKAIFAELKKLRENGAIVRLRPAANHDDRVGIDRRNGLRGMISWALVKWQEPHSVLILMSIAAVVRITKPEAGLPIWFALVLFWGIFAPVVAVVRLFRTIRSNKISSQFEDAFSVQRSMESGDQAANIEMRLPTGK
ncbi:hypothetical protein GC170_06750 [bacterium]|nr:hypothetical protein [bacterium]